MFDPITPIAVILATIFLIVLLLSKNIRPGLRFLMIFVVTFGAGGAVLWRDILRDDQRRDLLVAFDELVEGTPPPIDYDQMARRCGRLIGERTGADVSSYFNLAQSQRKQERRKWAFTWSIQPGTRQKIEPGRYTCSGDGAGVRLLELDGRSLL